MRSATQNKGISEVFFELLVFGFLLLSLGLRGVQINQASAAVEKRSAELSFFEKNLHNQAVKISCSDLQD
jgi:hypothetical protein